jgi:uncharacterized membrane protein
MNKWRILLYQFLVSLLPLVYLADIWRSLPAIVPTHSNINMQTDRYGSKNEILYVAIFLVIITFLCSLLILSVSRIDPRLRNKESRSMVIKFSWVVVLLLTIVSAGLVYLIYKKSTGNATYSFSLKYLVALISIFFAVSGHFMKNIKQNHFFGFRTPWALTDADNWRRTHLFGSEVWFFGGIIICVLALILPGSFAIFIMISGFMVLVFIPFYYSYSLFRQRRNT